MKMIKEVKQMALKRKNRKEKMEKQKERMLVTTNHKKIARQTTKQGKE